MELCGLINERVIDDVFRVHGAAPAELLANWRDVCAMFRFRNAQTYVNVSLICTYFSEAFKQYTDDSFVNDVKKMRLEEAKRMLAEIKLRTAAARVTSMSSNLTAFLRSWKELLRSNIAGNKKVSAFAEALRIDSAFVGSL
ncbi:hypothetical protein [Paenibacillus thiaminolyticus]|uniref:hypothetical protein n=1 Tax=Paenibacillus thiaminolyticus TaxID=49283 RepID=UPI0025437197|nr:hypothetical protein [Paenibacillus thiaminolyticus]WII38321.1 hypothetical protein O0V01_04040 [Paenibacillus thiaminolyticus]